jgi:hypothetical protein
MPEGAAFERRRDAALRAGQERHHDQRADRDPDAKRGFLGCRAGE